LQQRLGVRDSVRSVLEFDIITIRGLVDPVDLANQDSRFGILVKVFMPVANQEWSWICSTFRV